MHQQNILIPVSNRQPLKSPSPDRKTKNRISRTKFQVNNVKRYLESVKNNHKTQGPTSIQIFPVQGHHHSSSVQIDSLSKENEERLRKRIYELEVENNEYRVIAKECQNLALRNQDLQQQMILLLSEIEGQEEEKNFLQIEGGEEGNLFKIDKHDQSTKAKLFTEESSKQEISPENRANSFKIQNSQRDKIKTQPFRYLSLDSKEKEFSLITAENQKIKEIVDREVKQALKSFEVKFIGYVREMEDKLEEMKRHNLQIFVLKNKEKEKLHNSSSSSSIGSKKLETPIRVHPSKQRKESQNSLIDIDIQGMLDSHQSFGRSHTMTKKLESKIYITPDTMKKSVFNQIKQGSLDDRLQNKFTEVVMRRVFQNIESMRQNLIFVLGQKSRINEPTIGSFEEKVKKELKALMQTYFSYQEEKKEVQNSSLQTQLLNQNNQMRLKIKELNEFIQGLKKELKFKVDEVEEQIHHNDLKISSSRGLDFSYYKSQPQFSNEQFEQTQKRLIRVIKIMKSFNQQYQSILERSHALSLPQESTETRRIQ